MNLKYEFTNHLSNHPSTSHVVTVSLLLLCWNKSNLYIWNSTMIKCNIHGMWCYELLLCVTGITLQCQSRKLEKLSYAILSYETFSCSSRKISYFGEIKFSHLFNQAEQCFKVSVDDNQKQIKGFSWHLKWILHWWPVKALETPSSW